MKSFIYKFTPLFLKKIIWNNSHLFWKGGYRIFCISFQRTGTTSLGFFFKEHGYKVASYDKTRNPLWSVQCFLGDYEKIFSSTEFKKFQVFEDNPWFFKDFYKHLYHRFPKSKFILFTRNEDEWFNSMLKYNKGRTLGNTFRHCWLYEREEEYNQLNKDSKYKHQNIYSFDNPLDITESHREHYKKVYTLRNESIKDFFKNYDSDNRFIHLELEDTQKWQKLGHFFNIEVDPNYKSHKNKSI